MTEKTVSAERDVYRRITDHIIGAIEAGAGAWKMPWHNDVAAIRPVNATTGNAYWTVNVISLWSTAQEKGYAVPQWGTYKQWGELKAQVRKGERSSPVVFWKFRDKDEGTEAEPDGAADAKGQDRPSRRLILARCYSVFKAAQVDGYTPPVVDRPPVAERIEEAEQFFASTGMQVRHGGNRAFYRPADDRVQMPPFEAFPDQLGYYSTLAHKATHWNGAKARLDRDLSGRFGTDAYAAEELVAELGAAFVCADLELTNQPRPDHAAYVANWLKVLKADTRAIFTAAAKAQEAADHLHGLQPIGPMPAPTPVERPQPAPEPAQAKPADVGAVLARPHQQMQQWGEP